LGLNILIAARSRLCVKLRRYLEAVSLRPGEQNCPGLPPWPSILACAPCWPGPARAALLRHRSPSCKIERLDHQPAELMLHPPTFRHSRFDIADAAIALARDVALFHRRLL
jgi:hypothetical protein